MTSSTSSSQLLGLAALVALGSALALSVACSDGSSPEGDGTGGTLTGGLPTGGTTAEPALGSGGTTTDAVAATFRVSGRFLHDRCGEEVVLRGVNEMVVWSSGKDGDPEFAEIAKTGANVVRIVWNEEGSAAELDTAISNALTNQLIPMIEHHGATGEDWDQLPTIVDYWTSPEVLAVLQKHEANLLLNIANEAGDASVGNEEFQTAYTAAITQLRGAGLTLPLIIDAPQWGQKIDVLQAVGPALQAHDPEHNLMFSVHMWWDDADGTRVRSEIAESVAMELPLIVGEFAQHAVHLCAESPFAYKVLLEEAQTNGIGWLAWSWGGVTNNDCNGPDEGSFDMADGGVFGNWNETWAEEVAVTDPNSIANTSVRPASIALGACQ